MPKIFSRPKSLHCPADCDSATYLNVVMLLSPLIRTMYTLHREQEVETRAGGREGIKPQAMPLPCPIENPGSSRRSGEWRLARCDLPDQSVEGLEGYPLSLAVSALQETDTWYHATEGPPDASHSPECQAGPSA